MAAVAGMPVEATLQHTAAGEKKNLSGVTVGWWKSAVFESEEVSDVLLCFVVACLVVTSGVGKLKSVLPNLSSIHLLADGEDGAVFQMIFDGGTEDAAFDGETGIVLAASLDLRIFVNA